MKAKSIKSASTKELWKALKQVLSDGHRPSVVIVEKVKIEASQLKSDSEFIADALLVFFCPGRLNVLGPLVNLENEGLFELWDTPMAGFLHMANLVELRILNKNFIQEHVAG